MSTIDLETAARSLDQLLKEAKIAVANGIDAGLYKALKLSVTKYMVGGGKYAPVNPPPGPLRIRSGRLRRGIHVRRFKWSGDTGWGSLYIDDAEVPYGKVHEFGGIRVPVPARPFMAPSIEDILPETRAQIEPDLMRVATYLRLM